MITQDLSELESFVDSCPDKVKTDLAIVMNWWRYWTEQGETKLYLTAFENYTANQKKINQLFRHIETKHRHDNYFGAATSAAQVVQIVIPNLADSNGCDGTTEDDCKSGSGCCWCTISDAT